MIRPVLVHVGIWTVCLAVVNISHREKCRIDRRGASREDFAWRHRHRSDFSHHFDDLRPAAETSRVPLCRQSAAKCDLAEAVSALQLPYGIPLSRMVNNRKIRPNLTAGGIPAGALVEHCVCSSTVSGYRTLSDQKWLWPNK